MLANFDSSDTYQQGINLGDTMRFSESWSTRLAVSQDWFHTNNYNKLRVQTTEYRNHGVSPTASLMFKPAPNMTTYVTYASSLQAGDLAPGTTANAGDSLAPYRSKEYEVGYKASLGKIDLTAALFRIERPFANIDPTDNVFKISGQQVNKGLELSAVGQVVDRADGLRRRDVPERAHGAHAAGVRPATRSTSARRRSRATCCSSTPSPRCRPGREPRLPVLG